MAKKALIELCALGTQLEVGLAHIADVATDLKVDYTTGDLDAEAEIIAAVNATNTRVNAVATKVNAVIKRLEDMGASLTA